MLLATISPAGRLSVWAVLGDVLTPTQTRAPFSDIKLDGTVAFRTKLFLNSRSVVPGPAKTMALEDAVLACIVDVPSRPAGHSRRTWSLSGETAAARRRSRGR